MLTAAAATMDGQSIVNRQKGDSSGDAHLPPPVSWNWTEFTLFLRTRQSSQSRVHSRPRPRSGVHQKGQFAAGNSLPQFSVVGRSSVRPKKSFAKFGFWNRRTKKDYQHDPSSFPALNCDVQKAFSIVEEETIELHASFVGQAMQNLH